jgi:CRP/FNR family transcriptional regulator, cyclic AMP receptor protein
MSSELLCEKFECFRSFNASELNSILSFCERVTVPPGGLLWSEGYGENYAAFILDGKIAIKKQTEFNGKSIVVGIYTAGSVIGELCLLTDKPRAVSAEVLDTADLVVLHNHKLEEMIEEHPLIGLRLLRHIFLCTSKRLTKSYERFASMF